MDVECNTGPRAWGFRSDETDTEDTNDDGLVVTGLQQGDRLVLTIIDGGTTFQAAGLTGWSRTATGATGGGMVLELSTGRNHQVTFTVTCA